MPNVAGQRQFHVELTKPLVLAFLADQTARCSAPTASLRLTALKVFARWLAAEEGFDATGVARCPRRRLTNALLIT